MKKAKKLLIGIGILGALSVAACAPLQPPAPEPGMTDVQTQAQYQKDMAACRYEAEIHSDGDIFRYADILRACLQTRGWK